MSINTLSDQELIQKYLTGNDRAFEILLQRHRDKIYTSIYMFVRNDALAEDIFQEVFIKIIQTLKQGKYNHEDKFAQWASRIAYNMCVDQFRKNKRRSIVQPTDEFDVMDLQMSDEMNMEDRMVQTQSSKNVKVLLETLPPEQKEVVILRHYADMSFKEIAEITNVSINTALGRMRYALINLRAAAEEKNITL